MAKMTKKSHLSSSTVSSSRLLLRFLIILRFLIALRFGRLRNFRSCWKKDFPLNFSFVFPACSPFSLRSRALFAIFNASMLKRSCVSLWFTTRPDLVESFRRSSVGGGGRGGGGGGPKIAVTFWIVQTYLRIGSIQKIGTVLCRLLSLGPTTSWSGSSGQLLEQMTVTWIKGRRIKAEQKLNRRPRLARAKWTWVTHTHRATGSRWMKWKWEEIRLKLMIGIIWDKFTSPELKVLFLTGTFAAFTGSTCSSFTCKLLPLLLEMTMSEAWLITITSSSFTFLFLIVPLLSENLSSPIVRSLRPPLARAWKFEIVPAESFRACGAGFGCCTVNYWGGIWHQMRSKIVRPLIGGGTHVVRSHICIEVGAYKKLLQRIKLFCSTAFSSFQDLKLALAGLMMDIHMCVYMYICIYMN